MAAEQLEGKLSRALEPIKNELVRILCQMETAVEFVEESVELEEGGKLAEALQRVDQQLEELEESFRLGRIVQEEPTDPIQKAPHRIAASTPATSGRQAAPKGP